RDQAELAVQAAVPKLVEVLGNLVHQSPHPAGSLDPATCTTSGKAFGAPSGRGGTEDLRRWRSWVAGSHKRPSGSSSNARSIGVPGVSPLNPPLRVSGGGLRPLSGWPSSVG